MVQNWNGASAKVKLLAPHPQFDPDDQEIWIEGTVGDVTRGMSVEQWADVGRPEARVYVTRVSDAGQRDLLEGTILYGQTQSGTLVVHCRELKYVQRAG